MTQDLEKIKQVWLQSRDPVIYRRGKGYPLLLRLPYQEDNRNWLRNGKRNNPVWDKSNKRWECPKAWFNDLVERSLERWGKLYVIQPYQHQEKCAPACWNAVGHECECSCMGEHHGSQNPAGNWFIVSDTFATKWQGKELACRLLTAKKKR